MKNLTMVQINMNEIIVTKIKMVQIIMENLIVAKF